MIETGEWFDDDGKVFDWRLSAESCWYMSVRASNIRPGALLTTAVSERPLGTDCHCTCSFGAGFRCGENNVRHQESCSLDYASNSQSLHHSRQGAEAAFKCFTWWSMDFFPTSTGQYCGSAHKTPYLPHFTHQRPTFEISPEDDQRLALAYVMALLEGTDPWSEQWEWGACGRQKVVLNPLLLSLGKPPLRWTAAPCHLLQNRSIQQTGRSGSDRSSRLVQRLIGAEADGDYMSMEWTAQALAPVIRYAWVICHTPVYVSLIVSLWLVVPCRPSPRTSTPRH